MPIISITPNNIDQEHICCAIGNDKDNLARAANKKSWMKERFSEGLVFKRLDARGKVFVEYMPSETCWKPIEAKNFLVIHCLRVSGSFKGKWIGKELLKEVINDAKAQGRDGICVVTGNKDKPYLTNPKFYKKFWFETVDTAEPYFELLALMFNPKAEKPRFSPHVKTGSCEEKEEIFLSYSNQCPFMEEYTTLLISKAKELWIFTQAKKLNSAQEVKQWGSPFATFGIWRKGKFITHELPSEKGFEKLLQKYSIA